MFLTISCMRAFASGGKYFSTYLRPSASPSWLSVASAQRFQRGFISVAPVRYLPLNAKFSSTNGADSESAAAFSTCQRRYVFHCAIGVDFSS